jgi:hypothetical protein
MRAIVTPSHSLLQCLRMVRWYCDIGVPLVSDDGDGGVMAVPACL